jgi:hypothetical protein
MNYGHFPREGAPCCESNWYSRSWRYQLQLKQEYCSSLEDLVSEVPGKVSVSYTLEQNRLPMLIGVIGVDGTVSMQGVTSFTWFPPCAAVHFRRAQYVELDTSFRATRPYAYCVPLGIEANEAIPLGLIVGLSKSIELC